MISLNGINLKKLKKFNIILLLMVSAISLKSQNFINQKYDRQRYLMDVLSGGCYNLDNMDILIRIGSHFDFRNDTLSLSYLDTFFLPINYEPIKYQIVTNSAQICNQDGEFLAFFNGAELWDRNANKIALDVFYNENEGIYNAAYSSSTSVILPFPDKENSYLLIAPNDFKHDPSLGVSAAEDFTSVEFKESIGGQLSIVEVKKSIYKNKYQFSGALSACRHANGRDWWLVSPDRQDNTFYFF